jgi:hypothetical protein
MDWVLVCETVGATFAFAAIVFSVYVMARVRRGASVWIYLGITSFCMFFAMLLGVVGLAFPVNLATQRLEQYIFLLAGALSFALAGVKLHEMFVYK